MKKSLLVTLASLMTLALVGCNNTSTSSSSSAASSEPASSSSQAGEEAPDVTLPEGKKCAYLVKIDWGSLTLPSYASIFMSGCMNQAKDADGKITSTWSTGMDALEFAALDGHAGWYVGYTADAWNEATYKANLATGYDGQPGEYGLVLGYNDTAAIGSSSKGLVWNDDLKSVYCASFAYPANAKFTYATGDNSKIVLTADSFTKVPKKPEDPLTNYTLKVAFSKALPTWEIPHMFGSFNGWKTAYNADNELASRMTPNDDRTIWSFTFASIIPDTYAITMSLDYTLESLKSKPTSFMWVKPDNWNEKDAANTNLKGGNVPYTIASASGNNYTMADEDALTAVMTKVGVLADPSITYSVSFELTNTNATALDSSITLYVAGGFNGWNNADANAFTLADGKYTYTVDLPYGSIEWGVIKNSTWDPKLVGEGGANFGVTVTGAGTVKITGDLSIFTDAGYPTAEGHYGVGTAEFVAAA